MDTIEKKINELLELKRENEDVTESNKRHQQMLTQLHESNHIEFIEVLKRDVQELISEHNESPNQTKRRGLIRAIFAYIEGNLFRIKEEIIIAESHKRNPILDAEEIILLKEKSPEINRGKVKSRVKYVNLPENIKFTLNCYVKSAQINCELDLQCPEWRCLIESITVRNRITHPKNASELEISGNEIEKAYISYLYFNKVIVDLGEKKNNELELKMKNPGQILF